MQTHTLVVADVVHETDASRSLVLEVPVALRSRFRYRAGQFVTVEVPWGGFDVRRCYSLSSSPDVDAARGRSFKRAISPKWAPRPSVATHSVPRRTSAAPLVRFGSRP